MKHKKPSDRVYFAMKRVSRNKWLSPKEVMLLSHKFATSASHGGTNVVKYAVNDSCFIVGMIDGMPPFHVKEYGYLKFMKWCDSGKKRVPAELVILKLKLEGMKNGN